MAELQLTLTPEECQYLKHLLENTLTETRIEGRRTDSPAFKEQVLHEEEVIRALLAKLQS